MVGGGVQFEGDTETLFGDRETLCGDRHSETLFLDKQRVIAAKQCHQFSASCSFAALIKPRSVLEPCLSVYLAYLLV